MTQYEKLFHLMTEAELREIARDEVQNACSIEAQEMQQEEGNATALLGGACVGLSVVWRMVHEAQENTTEGGSYYEEVDLWGKIQSCQALFKELIETAQDQSGVIRDAHSTALTLGIEEAFAAGYQILLRKGFTARQRELLQFFEESYLHPLAKQRKKGAILEHLATFSQ